MAIDCTCTLGWASSREFAREFGLSEDTPAVDESGEPPVDPWCPVHGAFEMGPYLIGMPITDQSDDLGWLKRIRPSATAYVAIKNPGYEDPHKELLGKEVSVYGHRYEVVGVEVHAIMVRPYPKGTKLGLALKEAS